MFEENGTNQAQPPKDLPAEPADMFAGVDSTPPDAAPAPNALKSGLLHAKSNATVLPNPEYSPPSESETIVVQSRKPKTGNPSLLIKIILGIVGLFAVAALAYGGWFLYQKLQAISAERKNVVQTPPVSNEQVAVTETQNPTNEVPVASPATTTEQNQSAQILYNDGDSDNDGLIDSEEARLGTDPKNPDTDGDLLVDGDEVKIWGTDPLKKDTDGDGFDDGSEILNGYNPLGQGKIEKLPMPIVRFVSTTNDGTGVKYQFENRVIKN